MRIAFRSRLAGALCMLGLLAATAPDAPVADAAMRSDLEAVRTLVRQGADVNAAHGDGMTALHWAAQNQQPEMVRILTGAGANTGAVTRIGGYTPLHVASRVGSGGAVQALLEAGAAVDAKSTTGVTPLHLAALAGRPEVVSALLEGGATVDAREPAYGQTPLMLAASKNRTEAVRLLIARGADVNAAAAEIDLIERAAEDDAANRARDQVLDAFQAQAPDPVTWQPDPAQVQAAVRAARRLETKSEVSTDGVLQANAGFQGGNADDANPGFAAQVRVQGGLTPLLLAVRDGHRETVELLLEAGADVNKARNGDQTGPLLLATINGHNDLARYLLERGADPNAKNIHGATPLYAVINKQWAPMSRHPQPTYHLQQKIDYMEMMEALLDAGADPNARLRTSVWWTNYDRDDLGMDYSGATPFWRAAYGLDVPAMKLLLAHGADPDVPTMKGPDRRRGGGGGPDASGLAPVPEGGPHTPPVVAAAGARYGRGFAGNSHRFAPGGWMPTMKFLVEELGADVNARDADGYTPIHYAAARGDNEMILYLIEKGADPHAVARSGQTAVDMANGPVQRISPYLETIALLESMGVKNNHRCLSC